MNCAFKDILRGKNFETNLERDNDSLKFVPNHFCSPTNSVGKMSQKIISCFFWHCSQYVKMGGWGWGITVFRVRGNGRSLKPGPKGDQKRC